MKKQENEHKNHYWIRKINEKNNKNWVKIEFFECQHAYTGPLYAYARSLHAYACWGIRPYELMNTGTYA